jgi:TolB-like protein/DNA-binding winged helix-turn-helix (wHTH) protein/Tfp pilus assembly protein PilF
VESGPAAYRFGPYRLDEREQLLYRERQPVPLPPKAVQTLLVLLRRAGQLVPKEDLMREVWPDTFVEEGGLTRNISVLRKALGEDEGEAGYIETIPRRGYRFVAAVQVGGPPPGRANGVMPAALDADEATRPAVGMRSGNVARGRRAALLAVGALAAAAAAVVLWRSRTRDPGAPTLLVVLPFDNLTGDASQEYVSEGLTEELTSRLGRMQPRHLRVIGRASALSCKAAHKSAAQMARELGVDYVLEGSVRRAGERLRVSAQLVQARDETQIWADTYERGLVDTLAMEDEVAQAVAGAVRPVIAPPATLSARASPPSAEVRDAVLRGRYQWNKRTGEALKKAREDFEEAIRLDPSYAPAYSGLSDVYLTLYDYELMPAAEASPRAKEAALAAVARDPLLAEAHSSLAHAELHEWDWAAAEGEFKRALELDPSYVTAHHWYALCLTAVGRTDEAVDQMRIARDLDPVSLRVNADLGMALHAARRYDEAIAQERRTMDLDAAYPTPYFIRGMAYEQKGELPQAIADYEDYARRTHRDGNALAALGHAYAVAGRREEARRLADELAPRVRRGEASPFYLALVYAGLGDKEAALQWLEKAYRAHSGSMRYVRVDRRLDPLRSDPRYQDLMRRVGLPP